MGREPHKAGRGRSLRGGLLAGAFAILTGCTTTPGAVAPSNVPVGENFVELGGRQTNSSCGYTVLSIPVKNPAPLPTLIQELITDKGGDALIDVTSSSSWTFYLLGMANCLEVQGKVVRVNQ
jgi:hypothetical protein